MWRQQDQPGEAFLEVALCPNHAGNAKRPTAPVHLDGEQPLW